MSNFQYKSKNRVFKEFGECKNLIEKLDYAKQLKKDAYDHVYDLDLDSLIRKLTNMVIINH
jgi:hypothetical protein